MLRRGFTRVWLFFSDLAALALTCSLSLFIARLMGRTIDSKYYLVMAVLSGLLIGIYAVTRLYPGIGLAPPNEIRKLTRATSGGMSLVAIYLFVFQEGLAYSRLVFLLFWFFALFVVPITRLGFRKLGLFLKTWYEPVAIIGKGEEINYLRNHLERNRLFGYVPTILVDFDPGGSINNASDILLPIMDGELLMKHKSLLKGMGIRTAFILVNNLPKTLQELILYEEIFGINNAIIISELSHIGGSAIMPYDLQGVLGLEVQRNLFMRRYRIMKRLLNIAITMVSLPFVVPLSALLALAIRLDSDGPVFYSQERLGNGGKPFQVWKFRTMIKGADEVLAEYLSHNHEMRAEWKKTHKLKDDPRVTQVGKFLRKTSLDELPQLWNVLKGEMSLVGPRPIVEDEIKHYGDSYRTYTKVKPGMTGLWQVSGRNDTSYDYRVSLDEYYVRHWSIWLDLYILLRTVYVVIHRRGAY